MQINHGKKWLICFKLYKNCSWVLTSYYDEVMEVHSGVIIRIVVGSHNQGLQISHLSLNSNYHTVSGVGWIWCQIANQGYSLRSRN